MTLCPPGRRAWLLLEMLLALTIFIFTALAVLGSVAQGIAAAERTRDRTQAVDLARSTMARLEAGLGTVQNLAGPVPGWEPPLSSDSPFGDFPAAGLSDSLPPPSPWEVEIDTVPSAFTGLTHVTVTAIKRPSPESERILASFSLHQLVRIAPEQADTVGEPDAMSSFSPAGGRP